MRYAAHAVTGLRLAVTPVFAWSVARDSSAITVLAFAIAAITDFIDGRIARHFGTAGNLGRWLDHLSDIAFLLTAMSTYVLLGQAPWWVPASVVAAFSWYALDSLNPAPQVPTKSRIGHIGGVMNYVVVGTLVGNQTLGLHWIPPLGMHVLFALVPIYSVAGILQRLRRSAPLSQKEPT